MINTVVFDLGGVLIDWNPRRLYDTLIADEAEREHFLTEVCPPSWNVAQDGGRPWEEAIAEAIARHPDKAEWIRAYRARWRDMLGGVIEDTLVILERLKADGVRLLALTNWSADTFVEAREIFPLLRHFEGIVVSGEEKLLKPHREIFELLASRHVVVPAEAVFIDDSAANCAGARAVGFDAIHYQSSAQLADELRARGFLGA